jgi:uncharacterized iron-regulated protein
MIIRSGIAVLCLLSLMPPASLSAAEPAACLTPGSWAVPAGNRTVAVTPDAAVAAARNAQFVLLGEAHDNADHHRWQLHALGMLLAQHGRLVVGFEMFPRRVQPVLDRWVAGELTEQQLLDGADWGNVWGFDPAIYMPLFQFARLHRVPMVAMNVDRALLREVSQVGWAAVPAAAREGVGDPAPATPAYRDQLREVFSMHAPRDADAEKAFERFVEGQLTWDRAFAEALHGAARRHPGALAVGIVGYGHLRDGHGVPHQLRALGAKRVKVWLPVPAETPCSELSAGIADAVFAVENARTTPPQRLGIVLDEGDAGPQVREVLSGSIAESAGVRQGDRVVAAAGDRVSSASDLIAAVRRQAPGTWLPLKIVRAGKEIDLVAKFPAQP